MASVCPIDSKYPNEISALLSPPSPHQVQVISLNFKVAVSSVWRSCFPCASFEIWEIKGLDQLTHRKWSFYCSKVFEFWVFRNILISLYGQGSVVVFEWSRMELLERVRFLLPQFLSFITLKQCEGWIVAEFLVFFLQCRFFKIMRYSSIWMCDGNLTFSWKFASCTCDEIKSWQVKYTSLLLLTVLHECLACWSKFLEETSRYDWKKPKTFMRNFAFKITKIYPTVLLIVEK